MVFHAFPHSEFLKLVGRILAPWVAHFLQTSVDTLLAAHGVDDGAKRDNGNVKPSRDKDRDEYQLESFHRDHLIDPKLM